MTATFQTSRNRFGFTEITSATGPTDPESEFAGATITITRISALDLKPGMHVARFASWHDNGALHPLNVIRAQEIKTVEVEEKHGRRSRTLTRGLVSARVFVDFTDGQQETLLHEEDRPEYAWLVS